MYEITTIICHIPETLRRCSWQEKEGKNHKQKNPKKIIIFYYWFDRLHGNTKKLVEKFRNRQFRKMVTLQNDF